MDEAYERIEKNTKHARRGQKEEEEKMEIFLTERVARGPEILFAKQKYRSLWCCRRRIK